jgi:hypothetical protein
MAINMLCLLATTTVGLLPASVYTFDVSFLGRSSPQIPLAVSHLSWYRCTHELLKELECANLSVPLDWEAARLSAGRPVEKIDLLITRLPATGSPHERIGSLVYNPGGPGGLATTGLADFARNKSYLSIDLRRKFDISEPGSIIRYSVSTLADVSGYSWTRPSRRRV